MAIEERKERTRERIVETAIALFASNGPDHVSMEDIARDAQVSRGTLYNFFENRDSLLSFSAGPVMRSMTIRIRTLLGENKVTPEQAFSVFLEAWETDAKALKLMTILRSPLPSALENDHIGLIEAYTALFARVIECGGNFFLSNPASIAFLLFKVSVPLLDAMEKEGVPHSAYAKALSGLFTGTLP